ncbi:MAG: DUF2336 domain-containing protein [Alphaproteobacteria bacterium]|nr:DUF2336 domain-containing protein [Alphaproteobacteria bacterium]
MMGLPLETRTPMSLFTTLRNTLKNLFGKPPGDIPEIPEVKDVLVLDYEQFGAELSPLIRIQGEEVVLKDGRGDVKMTLPVDDTIAEADDPYAEIKLAVARKITRLLPEISEEAKQDLLNYIFMILDILSRDLLTKVRRILAEELKSSAKVPPQIIQRLAWDKDPDISSVVLEYSPLLSDNDLLEIVATSDLPEVALAIARRPKLSARLSTAIIESENREAIGALLANQSAEIDEFGLNAVIDKAPQQDLWHPSLVRRHELTQRMISRIAGFVSMALIRDIQKDQSLDTETAGRLGQIVSERLRSEKLDREKKADLATSELFSRNELTAEVVAEAIDTKDEEFTVAGLSLLSALSRDAVAGIMASQSPAAVTALCWKAGLTMRQCIQVQMRIAKIHHSRVLNAKDGINYPLDPEEMRHYLELFGDVRT